ncbi:MFS transporter [Xylariaceae sp. FL0255]|nr:MFS transporter [Xylariaceae sp. FL0255]
MSSPLQLQKPLGLMEKPPALLEEPEQRYQGHGIATNPYIVEFVVGDPKNPLNWTKTRKWTITAIATIAVFATTLASSAYSSSRQQILAELHGNNEEFAAGVSLFVLGFAIGPPFWGPLSELYGRRFLFHATLGVLVAFVAATAGCTSITQLLFFRLLSGTFGASPLTNSGGIISDLFAANERGLAIALFAAAPFLGPILGPILGGYVTITAGWRWVQGVVVIFIGVVWIAGIIFLPETYGPVILRKMASDLAKKDGHYYISAIDKNKNNGDMNASAVFAKALKRPWILLFREPIVLIASIYLSIIYATIYMFIPAFPIVFGQYRGWNDGLVGLAFLGVAVGMLIGLFCAILDDIFRYRKLGKSATPESRLPPCIAGAIALPIGLFGFAWTNGPNIHWSASIILSAPFGFGAVLVFLPILNYLVDSYTIYTASVFSAAAMLRAVIGAAFPLFTTQMFHNLGIHWASSIPGFLTVACLPFPFVMYKYGEALRMKCKYAADAALQLARLEAQAPARGTDGNETDTTV